MMSGFSPRSLPSSARAFMLATMPSSRAGRCSVDLGAAAHGLSVPWGVVGTKQRVADDVWIRGALEAGVVMPTRAALRHAQLGAAVVVGPRFALNPDDALVASVYVLGGIGVGNVDLSGHVSTSRLWLHGHGPLRRCARPRDRRRRWCSARERPRHGEPRIGSGPQRRRPRSASAIPRFSSGRRSRPRSRSWWTSETRRGRRCRRWRRQRIAS